jgi:hypothetical protein
MLAIEKSGHAENTVAVGASGIAAKGQGELFESAF